MKWQKAYTLIEILVVLTIIAILFGFGYISYRDFQRRQALFGAAKVLQGDLRLAQEQALAGYKPDGCTQNLDYYSFQVVQIDVNKNGYNLIANCGSQTVTVKGPVTPPPEILISMPNPNPIRFNVLGRGTNAITSPATTITLTQSVTNNTVSVVVTPEGEIK